MGQKRELPEELVISVCPEIASNTDSKEKPLIADFIEKTDTAISPEDAKNLVATKLRSTYANDLLDIDT